MDQLRVVINNALMGDIVERIGSNIRTVREKQGLSQEELGAIAGLHRAYIGQIERGEKNIGLQNLEKIANALDVDIRALVDSPRIDE